MIFKYNELVKRRAIFALKKRQEGFTLVEVLIDISVIALVATGILSAYSASFKAMDLAKAKTAAVALANEQMEELHNIPYDSLATEHGLIYPPGTIKDDEEVVRRGVRFNVRTVISYVDDSYDGNAEGTIAGKPKDLYPYDYKKVEVTVSKIGRSGFLARLTSNIAAKAAETPSNTGIVKLCAVDSTGVPVSGATLTIQNSTVNPVVDISGQSGDDGCIMVPNLPPDLHNNYHLTATKDGFSIDLTYPRTSQNPNEQFQDVNVLAQQVTIKTLVIDRLSTMEISFLNSLGQPVPNVPFHLEDSKEIYFNPSTYKYSKDLTADANGYVKLTDMEFGDYKLTIPSMRIAAISPYQPIGLGAGVNLMVKVTIADSPTSPVITSANPLTGKVNDVLSLVVTGGNFDSLASVKLINGAGGEIIGTNVVITKSDQIEADFGTQNTAAGMYDIVITNPNGESVREINGVELK